MPYKLVLVLVLYGLVLVVVLLFLAWVRRRLSYNFHRVERYR